MERVRRGRRVKDVNERVRTYMVTSPIRLIEISSIPAHFFSSSSYVPICMYLDTNKYVHMRAARDEELPIELILRYQTDASNASCFQFTSFICFSW